MATERGRKKKKAKSPHTHDTLRAHQTQGTKKTALKGHADGRPDQPDPDADVAPAHLAAGQDPVVGALGRRAAVVARTLLQLAHAAGDDDGLLLVEIQDERGRAPLGACACQGPADRWRRGDAGCAAGCA